MCEFVDGDKDSKSWILTNSTSISPGHDNTCQTKSVPLRSVEYENFGNEDGVGDILMRKPIEHPPIIDRTNDLSLSHETCTWLSTLPTSEYANSKNFIIFSRPNKPNTKTGCLTFYYHFFALTKATFYVQINTRQSVDNATNIWAKYIPQGNRWTFAQVHIPPQTNTFYIIFNAFIDQEYHDVVGLDDISYSTYECSLRSGNYDFESSNPSWITDGITIASGGSPIRDHTTKTPKSGHYALSSLKKQPSKLSASIQNITSSFISTEYSNCLQFYYQFIAIGFDEDTESYLDVNVTGFPYYDRRIRIQTIFEQALEKTWQLYSISIPSNKHADKNSNVTFSMFTSKQTQIAIDDIVVLNKPCPTIGHCNFELDFCGWSEVPSLGYWIRSDGASSASLKESPKYDNTTRTDKGWFAMLPNELLKKAIYASLESPLLGDPGTGGKCFQMAYFAHTRDPKDTVLTVNILDNAKYDIIIATHDLRGTPSADWQTVTIEFPRKMPQKFSIEITTNYSSKTILSDIAIDDLKLDFGCGMNDHRFSTSKPTPIPSNETKWNCNFDYECQGWTYNQNWLRTSFSKLGSLQDSSNPPRIDHNQKSHKGGYLLFVPKADDTINRTTVILGIVNSTNISAEPHCLTFYYFDSSEILIYLDVNYFNENMFETFKSIRPNAASRTWKRAMVEFRYTPSVFNISLVLHARSTANASYAIDDIRIIPGSCKHMEDYVYTLDDLENMELNRITPLRGGIGFLMEELYSLSYPNAPINDHTTGTGKYLLFMNRKGEYPINYQTELVLNNLSKIPPAKNGKGRCIRFAYRIVGQANLKVSVDEVDANYHNNFIFTSAVNHSNWVIAQATYLAYYEHKIVFVMTKSFDLTSYIALDDISFSDHCSEPIACDFDDDLCSYTESYNENKYSVTYEFARYVAPAITPYWPGPVYDHTKQSCGGAYLYLSGYPSKLKLQRTAEIQTPVVQFIPVFHTNSCISMFTYLTAPDAELTVSVNFFSKEGHSTKTELMKLTNLTETKWTRHFVDVDHNLFDKMNEMVLIIKGITRNPSTVIAIDDIDYSTTECSFIHKFVCDNKKIINVGQVCNIHDDCSDDSDEKECGTSNFEVDTCRWKNSTDSWDSKYGDIYVSTQTASDKDLSLVDGEDN